MQHQRDGRRGHVLGQFGRPAGCARWLLLAALLGGCGDDATEVGEAEEPGAAASETAFTDVDGEAPRSDEAGAGDDQDEDEGPTKPASAPPPDNGPKLGALAYATTVFAKPDPGSDKLGYLRLGAVVSREEERAGRRGCKGGWYRIQPKGYVCVGQEATLDVDDPLLRAARHRPEKNRPMPYRYGFVRAVLPLYLRVPTAKQQFKSEFKLEEHLEWFKENFDEVQKADLGANDVPVDERGFVIPGKKVGELGRRKNSTEMGVGELFGGETDNDPWPFWLREGKRLIPNVSGFEVPAYAVFADRARRHTGLAFIDSFTTTEHYLKRRFAVTTDLRLAPTTKVKPDSASPWHGVELGGELKLPLGIVRKRGVQAYAIRDGSAVTVGKLPRRSAHRLAGKVQKVEGERYYELADGRYAFSRDIGIAVPPRKFPYLAKKGEKWIEVDLSEQVLTLWEGKKPVYVTLVSTGRPAIGDPEETTATPRGVFRIYAKHITATMDSDQGAGRGLRPGDPGYVPEKGDGLYGKTLRRGHGTFQLRDVPYIQYFHKQYALHGAYWHDVFGIARSHGCINLAPTDALRVFKFTEPVPEGWHGVNLDHGTALVIHK